MESWQWELRKKFAPKDGYCLQAVKSVVNVICEQFSYRWTVENPDNSVCVSALDCLSSLTILTETHVFGALGSFTNSEHGGSPPP